jgi:hypothetical protein
LPLGLYQGSWVTGYCCDLKILQGVMTIRLLISFSTFIYIPVKGFPLSL